MMIHEQKAAYVFAEKSVLHGGKNKSPEDNLQGSRFLTLTSQVRSLPSFTADRFHAAESC